VLILPATEETIPLLSAIKKPNYPEETASLGMNP
jgi:hypothetical protein